MMQYGDIQGKGKIYTDHGELKKLSAEKVISTLDGTLHRGWVKYKLGWRTIMFKGAGTYYITDRRIVYLEQPEYIGKIHTFNLDHELGDFGGWDYHAHRMRRAVQLGALLFFELPISEITKVQHKKTESIVYAQDKKDKYKLVIEYEVGVKIEYAWKSSR